MIGVNLEFDFRKLDVELKRLHPMVQLAALDSGVKPAATIVKNRVKRLTPRSSKTGSTERWSKSTKARRQGEMELAQTVSVKVLKPNGTIASALVGYSWPDGNKAYFLLPMKKDTRKVVLWGNATGREARKMDDWMRQAFDETRDKQIKAFENGVVRAVERQLKRLSDG